MIPTIDGKLKIDVQRLLETRLLIQASSGGGKSYCLRRILEQTADKVQQLVIDPDGEFSTLREKFDYIIAAPTGGDAVADPRTAAMLATRLLESGVSAIIDIYELKTHERQTFVKSFCDALVNAPKRLWHPVLIVIDEAHVYAPEKGKGKAESCSAIIDLATRGRKRGFGVVLATQRLSKLNKDAAAECLNKMIGLTGLPADRTRAADELGLTVKEAGNVLRGLSPGEFYIYGPAFANDLTKTKVGSVVTTHPEPGSKFLQAPSAPSAKIKKALAKLGDLPKEAQQEARNIHELQTEVSKLRGAVTRAEKKAQQAGVPESEVQRRIKTAIAESRKNMPAPVNNHHSEIKKAAAILNKIVGSPDQVQIHGSNKPPRITIPKSIPGTVDGLRKGAVRILKELAARYPAGYTKAQVGALTRFSPKGGTFSTYMSDLRKGDFIEERDKLIYATENGITSLGDKIPNAPTSHKEAMNQWRQALRAGAYRMLEVIVGAGQDGISRDEIAYQVGMVKSGGTFSTYLSDLRRNGLMYESNGLSIANDILFPNKEAE